MNWTSLRTKLIGGSLAILLVAIVLFGFLLTQLFTSFFSVNTSKYVFRQAATVNRLVVANAHGELDQATFVTALGQTVNSISGTLWVTDVNGIVVYTNRSEDQAFPFANGDVRRVLTGDLLWVQVQTGPLGWLRPRVAVGRPLVIGGRIVGAIFLEAPVAGGELTRDALERLGIAGLVALLLAWTLAAFGARGLIRRLGEMGRAATAISQGRFDVRVSVEGRDEIGQLATSLNHMAGRLEELEHQRREFLAAISHELRTPITALRGFVQALLDGTVPEAERQRYLKLAHSETGRLTRLVNDLLDLSAAEVGQLHLARRPLDLHEVLQDGVDTLRTAAAENQVTVTLDAPDRPIPVVADPDRLRQILLNLLTNALHASPPGGVVTVVAPLQEDEEGVAFAVRDQGPGIAEQEQARIWERFYRGANARAHGSGLGLAITRALVEAHGGRVHVDSQPSRGATFTVWLPR